MSVTHDNTENFHLVYMLMKLLPGTRPGVDFTVATDYEADGETLMNHAVIENWYLTGLTQPTDAELKVFWDTTYKATYKAEEDAADLAEANRITAVVANALI